MEARALPAVDDVRAAGVAAGLAEVGVAPVETFTGTRADLEARKAAGLHGGMQFTYRNPARSTEPARLLRRARALVVGAYAYPPPPPPPPPPAAGPQVGAVGRVAAYATRDHYGALRDGLGAVADLLRDHGWRAAVVADDNALVDREAAVRAGLGWYGKNANVLLPQRGSWLVLGSVVTDAPLPSDARRADGCGRCRRCLDACPTGAIVAPGVVDARRCLAWTVQAPGDVPVHLRAPMGDRIYGCDDCQVVCPPNHRAAPPHTGPAPDDDEAWVDLLDLLAAPGDDLLARYGRWYIAGRDPDQLRRNALVALGNVGAPDDPRVVDALRVAMAGPSERLARHAAWAARRLGRPDLLDALPSVRSPELEAELAAPVPPRTAVAAR